MSSCSIFSMDTEDCLTFEAKPWKGSLRSRSNSTSDGSNSEGDYSHDRSYPVEPQASSSQHYKTFSKVTLDMTQLTPRGKLRDVSNTKDLLRVLRNAKNAPKRRSPLYHRWDGQEVSLSSAHQSNASEDDQHENKGSTQSRQSREHDSKRNTKDRHQDWNTRTNGIM